MLIKLESRNSKRKLEKVYEYVNTEESGSNRDFDRDFTCEMSFVFRSRVDLDPDRFSTDIMTYDIYLKVEGVLLL